MTVAEFDPDSIFIDEGLNVEYLEGDEELSWLNMELKTNFDYIDLVDMNLIVEEKKVEKIEKIEKIDVEPEKRKVTETRQQKIDRYLYKKKRRCWNRTKGYVIRQEFANARPRYKGRFLPVATEKFVPVSQLKKQV